MRLTDNQILEKWMQGSINFTPAIDPKSITGVTVDLYLGNSFRRSLMRSEVIDLGSDKATLNTAIGKAFSEELIQDEFLLEPGRLALGVTRERVSIADDLVGWLDGRSTLARLGLMVHITAHRIDPGWDGNIVLEFFNVGPAPLILRSGMKIGAISFEQLAYGVNEPYHSREGSTYRNQDGAKLAQATGAGDIWKGIKTNL